MSHNTRKDASSARKRRLEKKIKKKRLWCLLLRRMSLFFVRSSLSRAFFQRRFLSLRARARTDKQPMGLKRKIKKNLRNKTDEMGNGEKVYFLVLSALAFPPCQRGAGPLTAHSSTWAAAPRGQESSNGRREDPREGQTRRRAWRDPTPHGGRQRDQSARGRATA